MSNLLGKLTKNSIITVESNTRPGIIQKYLVEDVLSERQVKLIYQDEFQITPYSLTQLIQYMHENQLTQQILAELLDVSKSSVSRYLTGKREIPEWVFKRLGIHPMSTITQNDEQNEQLLQQIVNIQEQLDKIIKTLQKETSV